MIQNFSAIVQRAMIAGFSRAWPAHNQDGSNALTVEILICTS
jgi:hypothetical protein